MTWPRHLFIHQRTYDFIPALRRPLVHSRQHWRRFSATATWNVWVQRCGLLLQMSHAAWSVCLCVGQHTCGSVCVLGTGELCKNSWTDRDAVWGLTHVGILDGGRHWTNPFAFTRGDRTVMRPLVQLLWTLVTILLQWTRAFLKQVRPSSGTAVYPHMPILRPHAARYSTNGAFVA